MCLLVNKFKMSRLDLTKNGKSRYAVAHILTNNHCILTLSFWHPSGALAPAAIVLAPTATILAPAAIVLAPTAPPPFTRRRGYMSP